MLQSLPAPSRRPSPLPPRLHEMTRPTQCVRDCLDKLLRRLRPTRSVRRPVLAHRDASLRRTDWVAIGGIADMPGTSRTSGCDATKCPFFVSVPVEYAIMSTLKARQAEIFAGERVAI